MASERQAIIESATQYDNPDDNLGYGIPDYVMANNILTAIDSNPDIGLTFKIYPNPFLDVIFINIDQQVKKTREGRVEVTNLTGQVILREDINTEDHLKLDLSQQSAGIYFVNVDIDGNKVTEKVIKF